MNRSASWIQSLIVALILALSNTLVFAAGEPTGSLATARYGHAAATLLDGTLLVTGGHRTSGSISSMTASVEIYDPATGVFSAGTAMGAVRGDHAAVALTDGRVLVVGGLGLVDFNPANLSSAEVYDPATATWTAVGPMSTARRNPVALRLADGRVMVVGGDSTSTACDIFDPASGTFTPTATLGGPRQGFAAAVLQDGRVLVVGGNDPTTSTYLASAEIWDPATGLWSATGAMTSVRNNATATLLDNGKVLVAGGITNGSFTSAVAAAELYDPATGVFSVTGSLNVPRSSHRAARLGDGNVVVTGGYSGITSSGESSLERYDVAAGTWRKVGLMATARNAHTASLLGNGDVLVAGGLAGSVLASAEIVDPLCVSIAPSISPASASFPYTGGTGSVAITHQAGCYWRVTRLTSWLTITSAAEGTGNGSITYSVAETTSSGGRGATPIVADNDFSVSQSGNPCASATLSPTSQSFGVAGGSASVTLTAGSTCNWTVSGAPSWMTIASGGTGSATISYSVASNTGGAARSATVTIAGKNLVVSQSGDPCVPAPSISPVSQTFSSAGGSATVAVTAPASCTWTVSGKPTWVTSVSGGTGSASISITAASNSGAERTATFTIANNSYTVTQQANPCLGASITPTSAALASSGGTADVSVTAPAACTWSVTGKPTWITSASGGTGSATLTLSIAANTAAARSATLGIAGIAFTVTQDADPCYGTVSLSPTSQSFAAAGGTGSVSVTQTTGCAWSVANVPAWITITSGSPGNGNGVVAYSVAANTGAARSATLTIAGRSYTVSQSAAAPTAYCASRGNITSYEWIQQVTVAGSMRSTGRNGGYADFTGGTPIALARGANSVTLTPGFPSSSYTENWRIWIDFNGDFVFSDSELVYTGSSFSSLSGSITVPATALAGTTRMRISMKYGGAPTACESFTYGEVEDYAVTIP